MKIKVTDVVWDFFEGEESNLPTSFLLEDEHLISWLGNNEFTPREVEDEVASYLSEDYSNASVSRLRVEII